MALENDTGDIIQAQAEISAPESTETVNVLASEENLETIKKTFVEGKRHLICGNYAEAVDCLDECCRLYVKHYGEMSTECVDPYFYYGKSLLELERTKEQKVLEQKEEADGSEESGIDEEDDETDPPTEKNNSDNAAVADENETPAAADDVKNSNGSDQKKIDIPVEEPEKTAESEENGAIAPSEVCPDVAVDVDTEPKEKSNTGLEVAWEMVDLARVILEKEPSSAENQMRLANCRMVLGEINFANEEFLGAVDEFTACLEIYNAILPADDRKLSETYFQIGSSYDLDNQFALAADSFKKAISILELRKSNLEKNLTIVAAGIGEETKKEIGELSALLVDMKQRLEDTLDSERQKKDAKIALDECTGKVNTEVNVANGDGINGHEATDITHLVRKQVHKRPGEEVIGETEEIKRTKLENGDCVAEKDFPLTNETEVNCPSMNGDGEGCPTTNGTNGNCTTTTHDQETVAATE